MPRLLKVRLEGFSLYSAKKTIDVTFSKGAFCLAGANGMGKSTFLAALNYGLTGIVPDPNRRFDSVAEYYKYSLGFADAFFNGRIDEDDRDKAQVSIDLEIGADVFRFTRGVFEREQLRSLIVESSDGESVEFDGRPLTPHKRHVRFTQLVPAQIGLDTFEQFVFLQQFVFTFDERRHLLFWDEKVLEQALHLCFGLDPKDADTADSLRREAEVAGSLGRNFHWQAAELKKRLEQLESVSAPGESAEELDDIRGRHKKLTVERDEAEEAAHSAEQERADADLLFAKTTAEVARLSAEYERAFAEYLRGSASPAAHPVVKASLSEQRCGLCGSSGTGIVEAINANVNSDLCPLCGSKIVARIRTPDILKKLDSELAQQKTEMRKAMARRERAIAEASTAVGRFNDTLSALDRFEREYASLLEVGEDGDGSRIQRTIAGYREQISTLLSKRQKQYEKRDEKKKELNRLRRNLIAQYSEAEERFVPVFKTLAHSFLGINLDVRMEAGARGVSLTVSVDDVPRRKIFQLSESQRFFVDIALRMALLKFTSPPGSKASLLVDTPEGSLDIAYEKRAGDMFARFVLDGFNLIFTANINTSQLLLALASNCGTSHMRLNRMTSWTELSEVQRAEENLFNNAYQQISAALAKGSTRPR
jgi:energy-coupling factor transporter ATP-binding protein EcfA2